MPVRTKNELITMNFVTRRQTSLYDVQYSKGKPSPKPGNLTVHSLYKLTEANLNERVSDYTQTQRRNSINEKML